MKDKKPIHSLLLLDGELWRVRQISYLQSLLQRSGKVGKEVAKSLFEYLESQNVFVRYFSNHRLTESKIRISIGTKDQMITLIQTIKNWLNENS